MNNYIINNYDLRAIATDEDLDVLSSDNQNIIDKCNSIAIDEAAAYLSTKYNVNKLFKAPTEYIIGNSYKIGDVVYVKEISSGSPAVETGELTFYTCIQDIDVSMDAEDEDYFEQKDGRDQKLLEVVMTISLFYIHKRLSPNNIPTFRVVSYDGNGDNNIMSAIKWLTLVQQGQLFPRSWVLLSDESDRLDPEVPEGWDKLGNDPSVGMMWGNDMANEYIWYDEKFDKNIIRRQ